MHTQVPAKDPKPQPSKRDKSSSEGPGIKSAELLKMAELKGRMLELEKSLSWERDARAKAEREMRFLEKEKAKLEGQLGLSAKVEKSLHRYIDKLEARPKDQG